MQLDIEGKLALITGGDSGMGRATAEILLREGAEVALCDKTDDALADAARELSALGPCEAFTADLTKLDEVERLKREVESRMGTPDIVVHAAGTTGPTGEFLEIDDEGWMEVLQVDLMSAVRVSRAFIPGMRDKGWGRLVLVSSENAVQPYPEETPYNVAKAGIDTLGKSLSKAYGPDGVHVNVVAPAFVATPMTDKMMDKKAQSEGTSREEAIEGFLAEKRPGIVKGRRGRAEEVASVIAFLCSERASYVVGANWRVDGGSVMSV
ncbi:SDR family NAD(P)-dependent oxidoreductase [Salinarimonas ramus]|uniref:Ketoacyl reductase n=1 Tax=Salinarimonas ramus TaxID=690164 RepID=A0A917V327_9HYPH|nr:SDR family oxidoreductase [Salinarimonas ramus]GGK27531.1 ketoacyl reductase [Salinarimonas ramus]